MANHKIFKTKVLDRQQFETAVEGCSHRFEEIADLKKRKVITNKTRVFLEADIIEIGYKAYMAGWTECQLQENPHSRWSSDVGKGKARQIFLEAFK